MPPRAEHRTAVRAVGAGACKLLLRARRPVRGGPGAEAVARRTVPADAVLREPADDGLVEAARVCSEPQARGAADGGNGALGDISATGNKPARAWTPDLSVLAAGRKGRAGGPGVQHGPDVHPHAKGL